ncbi:MAG TPA: hypothetical protein VN256_20720 [Pyrinomonadaceae bacterium]|nr:hypothetical protein [Pyrinomonadaceae bacterium]
MRIPRISFIFVALAVLGCASCGSKSRVVEYDKIRDCTEEYEGQIISVEGYVGANRNEGLVACASSPGEKSFCLVAFSAAPDAKTKLTAHMDAGTGPNQVEFIPGKLDETVTVNDENRRRISEKIRFRAHDGKVLTTGDKVRITGKYRSVPAGNDWPGSCYVEVEKVEPL